MRLPQPDSVQRFVGTRASIVKEGALADLVLVNGNPLANIDLISDPDNFMLIMKDGIVYKSA